MTTLSFHAARLIERRCTFLPMSVSSPRRLQGKKQLQQRIKNYHSATVSGRAKDWMEGQGGTWSQTYHSPGSNDPSSFSTTLSTWSVLEPVRLATAASNLRPSLHKNQRGGIFAGALDILTLTGVRSPVSLGRTATLRGITRTYRAG